MILLPYPPSMNRYLRHTRRGTYPTKEALAFKSEVEITAVCARMKRIEGPVLFFGMLHPKTKKDGSANKTRIDVDNAVKVAIDALQGIAYANDKQICASFSCVGHPVPKGGLSVAVLPACNAVISIDVLPIGQVGLSVEVFPMGQGGIPAVLSESGQPAPPLLSAR